LNRHNFLTCCILRNAQMHPAQRTIHAVRGSAAQRAGVLIQG
ncbi:hypothetical protein A2U01_0064463, partial [Trifolium medium]|nr:hypothetical protein [Trifolium medium]